MTRLLYWPGTVEWVGIAWELLIPPRYSDLDIVSLVRASSLAVVICRKPILQDT